MSKSIEGTIKDALRGMTWESQADIGAAMVADEPAPPLNWRWKQVGRRHVIDSEDQNNILKALNIIGARAEVSNEWSDPDFGDPNRPRLRAYGWRWHLPWGPDAITRLWLRVRRHTPLRPEKSFFGDVLSDLVARGKLDEEP